MDAIITTIEAIGNAISSIIDFVISFFEDLAYIVKLTAEYVTKIPDFFSWLPAEVLAIVIAAFSIIVIYKVMGREG